MAKKVCFETYLVFRVTQNQKEILKQKSQKLGLNYSAFIRKYLIKNNQKKVTDGSSQFLINELINAINKIENNVMQIIRNENSELYTKDEKQKLYVILREISNRVDLYLEELDMSVSDLQITCGSYLSFGNYSSTVKIRITEKEKNILTKKSEIVNNNISQYIRLCLESLEIDNMEKNIKVIIAFINEQGKIINTVAKNNNSKLYNQEDKKKLINCLHKLLAFRERKSG